MSRHKNNFNSNSNNIETNVKRLSDIGKPIDPNNQNRKMVKLTDLSEQLNIDYRFLRRKLQTYEKERNVKLIYKEDESKTKTPIYIDTDVLYDLIPTMSPKNENSLSERVKDLELEMQAIKDILLLSGMIKK